MPQIFGRRAEYLHDMDRPAKILIANHKYNAYTDYILQNWMRNWVFFNFYSFSPSNWIKTWILKKKNVTIGTKLIVL